MKSVEIAVFPASSEVGMEIIRSLSDHREIKVIGVDSAPGPAQFICEHYRSDAPWANSTQENDYFEQFQYIFPANDRALSYFNGVKNVISHPEETIYICNSKFYTYSRLKNHVPCPDVYPSHTYEKPQSGHSAIGHKEHIFQGVHCEYLPGEEYTVDCFTQNGVLKYAGARTRNDIKTGISCKSDIVCNTETIAMAEAINKHLVFTGSWFFQCKYAQDGTLKLLEIGARVAGSSGTSRAAGVNLPLLHYYCKAGIEVEVPKAKQVSISRHLCVKSQFPKVSKVYFDYDDTLIINGKVNWKAIALAYKLGLECHILTRNKDAKLIAPFQSVIYSTNKEVYSSKDSLLIDDSFSERKAWIHSISPQQIDLYL